MKFFCVFSFLVFSFTFSISAQIPQSTPVSKEDDIVKISTTLIQVDATVTDKKGNVVLNLKPEDFEIYENGKKQQISAFSIINSAHKSSTDVPTPDIQPRNSIILPPTDPQTDQIRRSYAIVVDDLGLTFSSIFYVKEALKRFIKNQMLEGDLVAIVRTGGGIGALQSFTTNKRQLLSAVEKIRWTPQNRSGQTTFEPFEPTLKEELQGTKRTSGKVQNPLGASQDREFEDQLNDFRKNNFTTGTLGALNYLIRGMGELPGRKSVMLFSEGFPYNSRKGMLGEVFGQLRILADIANRSSVIIYTIDPRGLELTSATSEDKAILSDTVLNQRIELLANTQHTLRYLSQETGGLTFLNQNNINKGIEKVLDDQNSYYLLGYQPNEDTFDPVKSKFNKIVIKLKNPELTIRYRSGFFGITDEKIRAIPQNPQQKLAAALLSPFTSNGVNISLYPIYTNQSDKGDVIHALVYIDAAKLNFSQNEKGNRKANFDLIAMIFGDNGVPVGETYKNYSLEFSENLYQSVLKKGFVYDFYVPVKKAGAYQFRVALRDTNSNEIGSASQFLEVPDLKKDQLTISNILLDNYSVSEWKKMSTGQSSENPDEKSAYLDTTDRQYKTGSILRYGYVIYNAKIGANRTPNLKIQTRLIKDGKIVLESSPVPFNASEQNDMQRLENVGSITLGNDLAAGNYVLQIIAIDENISKQNLKTASQWIDFEITN